MDINVDKRRFPSREEGMVDCRSGEHKMTLRFCFIYEWGIDKCDWKCDAVKVWTRVKVRHVRKKAWCFKRDATHKLIRRASGGREYSPSIRPWWLANSLLKIWGGQIRLILRFELHRGRTSKREWCGRAESYIWMWWVAPTRLISPRHESVT